MSHLAQDPGVLFPNIECKSSLEPVAVQYSTTGYPKTRNLGYLTTVSYHDSQKQNKGTEESRPSNILKA